VLHLLRDHAKDRRAVARQGSVAGDLPRVCCTHQEAIVQGPDRTAEVDDLTAFFRHEEASRHHPAIVEQPLQQLCELGLDWFKRTAVNRS